MTPRLGLVLALLLYAPFAADARPCGMVGPRIEVRGPDPIITLAGAQKTYVFFKNGVESVVVRPGFKGKIDTFGMLLPCPSVPSLRKVPDQIFGHVASAIDPPEVTIDLNSFMENEAKMTRGAADADSAGAPLAVNTVKVLKEEAVGMYEVAVLAAGSTAALTRWMDDHGFHYPDGMESACEAYVKLRWCFVAVKVRVGRKGPAEPRPGMRHANPDMPAGSNFSGNIQAMGLRFKSERLVLPMRLTAHNPGQRRTILYVLCEKPVALRDIPAQLVRRQVPGATLLANVTQPLPVRIIGGVRGDVPDWTWQQSIPQRNPVAHNGHAKDLFAADLQAAKTGRLNHPHEEREKEFLRIGGGLGLKAEDTQTVYAGALATDRKTIEDSALKELATMTLTVVDGELPLETLTKDDVTTVAFAMPSERNTRFSYDARSTKPAPMISSGMRIDGARAKKGARIEAPKKGGCTLSSDDATTAGAWVLALLVVALLGWRRSPRLLPAAAFALALVTIPTTAQAQDGIAPLIWDLGNTKRSAAAVDALVAHGETAVPRLIKEVERSTLTERRGWALVALSRIGGDEAQKLVDRVVANHKEPKVVRMWAFAAYVRLATSSKALFNAVQHHGHAYPEVQRLLTAKLVSLIGKEKNGEDAAEILVQSSYTVSGMYPHAMTLAAGDLLRVVRKSKDQTTRHYAHQLLATKAQQGDGPSREALVSYFSSESTPPWSHGLYFDFNILSKDQQRRLLPAVFGWYVWAEAKSNHHAQSARWYLFHLSGLIGLRPKSWTNWNDEPKGGWIKLLAPSLGRDRLQAILDTHGNPKRLQDALNAHYTR